MTIATALPASEPPVDRNPQSAFPALPGSEGSPLSSQGALADRTSGERRSPFADLLRKFSDQQPSQTGRSNQALSTEESAEGDDSKQAGEQESFNRFALLFAGLAVPSTAVKPPVTIDVPALPGTAPAGKTAGQSDSPEPDAAAETGGDPPAAGSAALAAMLLMTTARGAEPVPPSPARSEPAGPSMAANAAAQQAPPPAPRMAPPPADAAQPAIAAFELRLTPAETPAPAITGTAPGAGEGLPLTTHQADSALAAEKIIPQPDTRPGDRPGSRLAANPSAGLPRPGLPTPPPPQQQPQQQPQISSPVPAAPPETRVAAPEPGLRAHAGSAPSVTVETRRQTTSSPAPGPSDPAPAPASPVPARRPETGSDSGAHSRESGKPPAESSQPAGGRLQSTRESRTPAATQTNSVPEETRVAANAKTAATQPGLAPAPSPAAAAAPHAPGDTATPSRPAQDLPSLSEAGAAAAVQADEKPQGPAARQIQIDLGPELGERVTLNLRETAGDVRVSVHSPDPNLRDALNSGLKDLTQNLERAGFQVDGLAAISHSSGAGPGHQDPADRSPDDPGARDQTGQSAGGDARRQQSQQQQSGRRGSDAWRQFIEETEWQTR